jgi:hypothetical protein
MERFVFVIAVTVAIIFGVVAVFGGPHWDFDFDVDSHGMEPVVEASAGRMAPQTFQGASLDIKHAAAIITITPEDRQDISVEVDNPGRAPMPVVSTENGHVIVDGRLRGRIGGCREDGVSLRGYGLLAPADLPRIQLHVPRNVLLDISGASTTTVGAAQAVDADLSGCGETTFGDVADTLKLDISGSGDVHTGAARRLDADVAGSSTVTVGALAEGADIDIAGSGQVEIASLTGALKSDGAGSGGVNVHGGAVTTAKIDLAGSGDVDIAATVQSLDVSIVGSGDVAVTQPVGEIDAEIAGSGSVSVPSVTGAVRKQIMGSGNVNIGE